MDVLLSPVADQGRGGEHLLHVGVLYHGKKWQLAIHGTDRREVGLIMNDKNHPVGVCFVTYYFLQRFRSWYFSGFFSTIVNMLRFRDTNICRICLR